MISRQVVLPTSIGSRGEVVFACIAVILYICINLSLCGTTTAAVPTYGTTNWNEGESHARMIRVCVVKHRVKSYLRGTDSFGGGGGGLSPLTSPAGVLARAGACCSRRHISTCCILMYVQSENININSHFQFNSQTDTHPRTKFDLVYS